MKKFVVSVILGVLCACTPLSRPDGGSYMESLRLIDQGSAQLREGKLREARASFEVAQETFLLPAVLDGLGCVALLERDFDSAEKYFLGAFQLDAGYAGALSNLALLYEAKGMKDEAQNLYNAAVRLDPQNARTRNNLAVFLYEKMGDVVHAREELYRAQAVAMHPLMRHNMKIMEGAKLDERKFSKKQ